MRAKLIVTVAEEGFEAVVHVGLDVAVEEGEAGLVGGELRGGYYIAGRLASATCDVAMGSPDEYLPGSSATISSKYTSPDW